MKSKLINCLIKRVDWGWLTIVILFAISALAAKYFDKYNEYLKYQPVLVKIEGHVVGQYNSLYLIVSNKKWGTFDILVSPTTYYKLKKGDKTVFKLREMDIRQTPKKNLIWFTGSALLWALKITLFIMILLYKPIIWFVKGFGVGVNNSMLKMPFLGFWF